MFLIPNYKPHKTGITTSLDFNQTVNTTLLKPRLFIAEQYPLPELTAFVYRLFDPFDRITYKVTSINNLTDSVTLTKSSNLASVTNNSWLVNFTDYTLVVNTGKEIKFEVTVFRTVLAPTSVIDTYGFVLESVNIKGHIASYTYDSDTLTLNESFLYPLPIALNLSLTINTDNITNRRYIYQVGSVGYTPDYVLYNNKYYNRSRFENPLPNEFTYTSEGVLLWT